VAFTKEQRIKGCEKAIASPRTPAHLKAGLKKHLQKLKKG
jgi:hypothetical protein